MQDVSPKRESLKSMGRKASSSPGILEGEIIVSKIATRKTDQTTLTVYIDLY